MKNRIIASFFISLTVIPVGLMAGPYTTLNKNFNRLTSRAMVRRVALPTAANLDAAAYLANPVLYNPQPQSPKKPLKKITIGDLTFNGAISPPCASLSQMPLTAQEKEMPLAWAPLQNRLWEVLKKNLFAKITAAVNGEKWADPSLYTPYQEIVCAYLHGEGDSTSFWIKIEFKPWVRFIEGIADDDHDGVKECYGRVELSGMDHELLKKVIGWIRSEYTQRPLTREHVIDWANTLASYWYPKLNTDVVNMTGEKMWPTTATEKEIRRELKGFTIADPLVVIRGNPYGKVIYNVFVVDFPAESAGLAPASAASAPAAPVTATALNAPLDSATGRAFRANAERFAQERATFGDYATWTKNDEPFRRSIADYVKRLPAGQMAFAGKDGWLFFRHEIDFMNGGDLADQPANDNPLLRLKEFKSFLDMQGISLLFCPVPNKSDICFEKLPGKAAAPAPGTIINPYARKFLSDLQEAGIEVIDLLPDFLAAKLDTTNSRAPLYQQHDTHWTARGLQISADRIAERIRQYSWYGEASKNPLRYTLKDTSCIRLGDLVDKLPEAERDAFPADSLEVQQVVNPDGSLYKANSPDAPILLIGDSFTGVFELIDCKSAGVGAHIAAATGLPVDIITSWGGGPLVRDKMLRARKNNLGKKRVVVYLMASRDLYHYKEHWLPLEKK